MPMKTPAQRKNAESLMDGLACPNCGQSVAIDIEVQTQIRVDREDIEIHDNEFQLFDGCEAGCPDCHHVGPFEDFKVENQKSSRETRLREPLLPEPTIHESAYSRRLH